VRHVLLDLRQRLAAVRRGSLTCSQICASERCCHACSSARRARADGPARRRDRNSRSWWQVVQRMPIAPCRRRRAPPAGCADACRALRRPLADRMAVEAARVLDHLARFGEQGARAFGAVADRRRSCPRCAGRPRRPRHRGPQPGENVDRAGRPVHRLLSTRNECAAPRPVVSLAGNRWSRTTMRLPCRSPARRRSRRARSSRTMVRKTLALSSCLVAVMTLPRPRPAPSRRASPRTSPCTATPVDDYFWMRQRDDPRTLPYLRAENAYADAWFRTARRSEGNALPGDVRPDPAGR
jgi:hypothetical protein